MNFLSKEHAAQIKKLESLWKNLHFLQKLALSFGIEDIFQDNGAKILQQLIYLNFNYLKGREGNDAIDENGQEWEMKSINIATSAKGFSTNHHLNGTILKKYRQVPWSFAIYEGIELKEIYVMPAEKLEPMFLKWKKKLKTQTHINNPKIPIAFVKENGFRVFPYDKNNPQNPCDIL